MARHNKIRGKRAAEARMTVYDATLEFLYDYGCTQHEIREAQCIIRQVQRLRQRFLFELESSGYETSHWLEE